MAEILFRSKENKIFPVSTEDLEMHPNSLLSIEGLMVFLENQEDQYIDLPYPSDVLSLVTRFYANKIWTDPSKLKIKWKNYNVSSFDEFCRMLNLPSNFSNDNHHNSNPFYEDDGYEEDEYWQLRKFYEN
jgi:hypothetical protein